MEASHLITEIKGVGVKTTALFSKLHIETIKDLISYFPRGYDHYEEALPVGELCTGKVQSVRACIVGTPSMVRAKGMVITHAQAGDASGRMKLTWFRMPYLKSASGRQLACVSRHGTGRYRRDAFHGTAACVFAGRL